MAKDPAFPFYTSDFLTGITFMSDEEVGIYVRLLCYQHQHGGIINKDDFNLVTKGHDKVRKKFIECEEGFYNLRLMTEMVKRAKKSSNLSDNAKQRWAKCNCNANAMQMDMPTEIENEIENEKNIINKNKRFKKPTIKEVADYCCERNNRVDPEAFIDFYESKGWRIGNQPMKDWKACVRTWEKRESKKQPKPKKPDYWEEPEYMKNA